MCINVFIYSITHLHFVCFVAVCQRRCGNRQCVFVSKPPGINCLCDGTGGHVERKEPCDSQGACATGAEMDACDNMADEGHCECDDSDTDCRRQCLLDALPCQNSGTAMLIGNTVSCRCRKGYFDRFCERFDPCSERVCMNEASCKNISSTGN